MTTDGMSLSKPSLITHPKKYSGPRRVTGVYKDSTFYQLAHQQDANMGYGHMDPGRQTYCLYEHFLQLFKRVFNQSPEGREMGEQLLSLKQGTQSDSEYTLWLPMLAPSSGWNKPALKAAYHQGLNKELFTEIVCRDDHAILDSMINMSICLDNHLKSRKKH